MEIKNTLSRPLRVPLPGGKKLHLGPGHIGQISPKAADHPPLKAMIEAGEIEVLDGGRKGSGGGGTGKGSSFRPGRGPGSSGIRHVGDR